MAIRIVITAFAALLAWGGVAAASARSLNCNQAAAQAAADSDVPLELLQSIALVETGRSDGAGRQAWPWTINHAGQGHWFDSKAEAIEFAEQLLAQGSSSFDVGCFQVNLRWHPDAFASIDAAFDPATNAAYAADYLSRLLQTKGDWPAAIAAYHSQSPDRGVQYLTKVQAALDHIRGSDPTEAPVLAGRRGENRFPLLLAGAVGNGASLVPMASGARPLFEMAP